MKRAMNPRSGGTAEKGTEGTRHVCDLGGFSEHVQPLTERKRCDLGGFSEDVYKHLTGRKRGDLESVGFVDTCSTL